MNRRRLQSVLIRGLCLVAALVLIWPLTSWEAGPRAVVATSSMVAISASIANRAISLTSGIGLIFALLSMFKRRWYCRYLCPTGLVLDGIAYIGLKKSTWWARWPPFGQYIAALTLAGALIGYPVLLWLDPMALFGSPFAIVVAPDLRAGLLAGIVLGILLPLTLLLGGVWCGRLCPLGGFQDQLAALALRRVLAGGLGTIRVWLTQPRRRQGKVTRTRRAVIASILGVGLGFWGRNSGLARAATEDAPLRPPGALPEEHFAGACIRCGNCTAACPSAIIRADTGGAGGLPGLLAPLIRYDAQEYCREDCNLCTQVCPSGALQALDLAGKNRYIIGAALVDTSICLLALGKKECDVCVVACPYKAVAVRWDDDAYISYPVVDPGVCNGCGACEVACPTNPVKSISVWSLLSTIAADGSIREAFRFLGTGKI